ncbi:hypothetical protein [uncultured Thiodictyon sp.]|uniref:SPOR domain-containing protein n=1 Tax=uncultured Thiodictyon sp. TaxID=1846217 RepID=UPI002600EDF4|nr:hypothetical protein [uncultured Thiodictyon sp.]
MAEPQERTVRDDPFAPDLSLQERLHALEAAWGEPLPGQSGAQRQLAEQAAALAALAAEAAAQRERLRDREKALVERIADVDDDRRLNIAQLQRESKSQREELEARLRRHGRVTVLALCLAVAGSGLVALYAYWRTPVADLSAEVATLRQDLQRLSGIARQDTELQDRLTAIATVVGQVSGGVVQDPALAARLDQLAAEQGRQGAELVGVQRSLQAVVAGMPSKVGPSVDPQPASPSRPLKSAASEPIPEPAPKLAPAPIPAPIAEPAPQPAPALAGKHQLTVTDRPFALQISGGYHLDKILEMAAGPNLPARVYVYQDVRRGRPWFVLIHSIYKSRADAQAAVGQLPPQLRPWIRSLTPGAELKMIEPRSDN